VAAVGEDEEQPHYGWARVLVGAYSCSFCAMLASRGAVYDSKQAAEVPGGSGLGAYHAPYLNKNGKEVGGLCDCQAVLVVDGKPWEGQAAQKKLNQLWKDHGQGQGDPLNAFRREWERQVRAGETQRYLPPSVQTRAA
jgi:hypothetical protein